MMASPVRAAAAALALLLAAAGGSLGEPVSRPEPADPLPWAAERTYADLVRLVLPGDGTADFRHIGGEDMANPLPAPVGPVRIAAVPLGPGGAQRLALLLDPGPVEDAAMAPAILALFDMAGEPRLVDAADVGFDRFTGFAEPARLPLGGNDLLITSSVHWNSGQSYAATALILVRGDRLELVDTIFTLDERTCAYERTQRLAVRSGAEGPFPDIAASVTELTAATGADCGDAAVPEPGTRTIAATWRWDDDARRYIPDSDAFDALARENETRF
jgi:hypothetical protein